MDKVNIDGIDVSECNFYRDKEHTKSMCKKSQNCYYKQLKRKEQECEKWEKLANEANERANYYANDIGKLQEDVRYYKELSKDFDTKLKLAHQDFTDFIQKQKLEISELKAENERLKANKGRCAFKCLDNTFCPESDKKITELELSRDSYKVSYETAKKYREKAEKALQEIREYCEEQNLKADYTACEIISKINEVIGAEE